MTITNLLHASDISCQTKIGANVRFGHGGIGIIIHQDAEIGDNCYIYQGVTISGKNGGCPRIGNDVVIGTNSVVLGCIQIGDNSTVGALSFVTHDVQANSVVGGVPAKILSQK